MLSAQRGPVVLLAVGFLCTATTAAAQSSALATKRVATGIVEANRVVTISAKLSGRVEHIGFQEGDSVAAGDVLLSMDAAQQEADLAAAEASLALAKVEGEHARRTEERVSRLFKQKTVSEDALDEARFGYQAAVQRVRVAEAEVARAATILKETRLLAPFAAIVTEKNVEVGQVIQPGEPLFVLEDQSALKLRSRVKEQDIPFIRIGQPVVVSVDALDDLRLEATVSKIIPSGDAGHTFVVEVALPSVPKLYPGMFGKVNFPD